MLYIIETKPTTGDDILPMLTKDEKQQLAQITDYWFNLTEEQWFTSSEKLDQDIRDRFMDSYLQFRDRDIMDMDLAGEDILALIILFDQMPRNMFRNSAQAFATDGLARALCFKALAGRHDLEMTDLQKAFVYMPLEHSEDPGDQELCVSLFQQRTALKRQTDYAVLHYNIIKEFGRFPHRNKLLNRTSTPAETAYLESGGETFGTTEK